MLFNVVLKHYNLSSEYILFYQDIPITLKVMPSSEGLLKKVKKSLKFRNYINLAITLVFHELYHLN